MSVAIEILCFSSLYLTKRDALPRSTLETQAFRPSGSTISGNYNIKESPHKIDYPETQFLLYSKNGAPLGIAN